MQLEETLWEAVATGTGASGPDSLPASLLPNGLGGEGDGPGSGGACVVRGSPGNGEGYMSWFTSWQSLLSHVTLGKFLKAPFSSVKWG